MSDVYAYWGASQAEDKTTNRSLNVETLGYVRDGIAGAQYSTEKSLLSLVSLTTWVLQKKYVTVKCLQIVGGRWCRQVQLRRELSCLLSSMWRALTHAQRTQRPDKDTQVLINTELRNDLVCLLCAVPLLVTDLRLRVDPVVTVSDANEDGCDVCRTDTLTIAGQRMVKSLSHVVDRSQGEDWGVLNLFGGIGGLRQAFSLNGLHPSVSVNAETDPKASRACKRMWPTTIQWGDVFTIDEERIKSLLPLSTRVKHWLVGGGFPSLTFRAHRQNYSVLEIARVARLVRKVFHWCSVKRFYENVASMPNDDVQWITETVQSDENMDPMQLINMDGRDLTPTARDRLYWIDWVPESDEHCIVSVSTTSYGNSQGELGSNVMYRVHTPILQVPTGNWTDPGTEAVSKDPDHVFPTFVRSMPRKRPPREPTGIEQCNDEDIERWRLDEFRYPPCHYQEEHLLYNSNGFLVTPTSTEREKLLMYPPGISAEVFVSSSRKDPVKYEDARLCALGGGFHCGSVAILLNRAMRSWGYEVDLLSPQAMVLDYFGRPLVDGDALPEARHSKELVLTRAIVSYQADTGGDVRPVPGREFKGDTWPRMGVDPGWWTWKVVMSHPWGDEESIYMLKARAVLHALSWRTRSAQAIASRVVHLSNSQVTLGALNKFRSPTEHLNRVITRIAATCLAGSMQAIFAYVAPENNPAVASPRVIGSWRIALEPRLGADDQE